MFHESEIPIVKGTRLAILREDFLEFCDSNRCAAILISYFEYWHKDRTRQVFHSMQLDPTFKPEESDYYQQQSIKTICDGILNEYKRETVSEGVNFLINKGVLRIIDEARFRQNTARTYLFVPGPIISYINNEFGRDRKIDNGPVKTMVSRDRKIDTNNIKTEDKEKDSLSSVGASAPEGKFVRRKKNELFGSNLIEEIFNHWNELGYPLSTHKINPSLKTFQNSILAIKKALQVHSSESIKQAMTKYVQLLNNKHTTLFMSKMSGVLVTLPEFFKFAQHTEDRMLKTNDPLHIENWFKTCLKTQEQLESEFAKYDKDDNPKITQSLITEWKKQVSSKALTVREINIFIRSARLMLEYHQKNKDLINWNGSKPEKLSAPMFTHRVVAACLNSANGDTSLLSPEWLCGPKMYTERMPKYLRKIGMLTSEDIKSYNAPKSKQKGVDRSGDISLSSLLYD